MSDSNYFNRIQRQLFSDLGTQQEAGFSDIFLERALLLNSTVVAQNPILPARVLYPETSTNGYFRVDNNGTLIIEKKGLYNVSFQSSFSPFVGDVMHYVTFIINSTPYDFGQLTTTNTNGSLAEGSHSVLSSSVTISLNVGDRIDQYVGVLRSDAGPNFTLYSSAASNKYTTIKLVYLSQP